MTNDEFSAIAQMLFGGARGWQTAFALAAGVSTRAVNRVAAGEVSVSRAMIRALISVGDRRQNEVDDAVQRIEAATMEMHDVMGPKG